MSDITLDDIGSGYNRSKIVSNFNKLEAVVNEETLHTTGGNNTMSQQLDMNGNRILNSPAPVGQNDLVRLSDLGELAGLVVEEVGEYVFPSVLSMKASSLEAGSYVWTKGYYNTPESEGGAKYKILTAAEYVDTPDEFGDHTLANGNVAVLSIDRVDSRHYGVQATGDSSAAINAMLAKMEVVRHDIDSEFSDTIVLQDSCKLIGTGKLTATNFNTSAVNVVTANGSDDVTIEGIQFDVSFFTSLNEASYPSLANAFELPNCVTLNVKDCLFQAENTYNWARFININSSSDCNIIGNTIQDVRGEGLAAIGFRLLIQGNTFKRIKNDDGVSANRAVIAGGSEEIRFLDNLVEDTEFVTNKFDSVAALDVGAANNVIISNNVLKNVAVGIDIEAASGNSSDQVVVTGNVVSGREGGVGPFLGNGIWINFASESVSNVVISGNTIKDFNEPLQCSTSKGVVISDNVITGDSRGINLESTYRYTVTGNTITMSGGVNAIRATSINDAFAGGLISNNTIVTETVNAMYIENFGGLSGSDRLPREWVIVSGNNIVDTRANGSRTANSYLKGRIKEWGNVYNFSDFTETATPSVRTGDTYRLFAGSPVTFTDFLDDGCMDREINILCRSANMTFDFSGTNLKGNGGVDITPAADSLVVCRKVDDGFGVLYWVCSVREA